LRTTVLSAASTEATAATSAASVLRQEAIPGAVLRRDRRSRWAGFRSWGDGIGGGAVSGTLNAAWVVG
jgi:hypothetical protein